MNDLVLVVDDEAIPIDVGKTDVAAVQGIGAGPATAISVEDLEAVVEAVSDDELAAALSSNTAGRRRPRSSWRPLTAVSPCTFRLSPEGSAAAFPASSTQGG